MATAHPPPPAGGEPPRPVAPSAPSSAQAQAQAEAAKSARGKPSPARAEPARPEQGKLAQVQTEPGLILAPRTAEEEETGLDSPVVRLPVALAVMIPVRAFRVRHMLALAPGHLIETRWSSGEDLPLASGNVRLAWSEFEVVDTQLAVRITRLA
jgi:flagellar motor switch/type III secretory pathway protein FliN